MAGASIPNDIQGKSLVPLMKGETPDDWRGSIYYHYYEYPSVHIVPRHNGIRRDRYKLMHFYQFDEWEFYDLQNDPEELNNLYGNPEYSKVINSLKKQLVNLQKKYGDDTVTDPMPEAWRKRMRSRE